MIPYDIYDSLFEMHPYRLGRVAFLEDEKWQSTLKFWGIPRPEFEIRLQPPSVDDHGEPVVSLLKVLSKSSHSPGPVFWPDLVGTMYVLVSRRYVSFGMLRTTPVIMFDNEADAVEVSMKTMGVQTVMKILQVGLAPSENQV